MQCVLALLTPLTCMVDSLMFCWCLLKQWIVDLLTCTIVGFGVSLYESLLHTNFACNADAHWFFVGLMVWWVFVWKPSSHHSILYWPPLVLRIWWTWSSDHVIWDFAFECLGSLDQLSRDCAYIQRHMLGDLVAIATSLWDIRTGYVICLLFRLILRDTCLEMWWQVSNHVYAILPLLGVAEILG